MKENTPKIKKQFKALLVVAGTFVLVGFFLFVTNVKRRIKIPKESLKCNGCNVVLVQFDTLRASHVSALGYKRKTTPTIDSFADRGFTFTNAISVSSWTLPSTMSIFTGTYPHTHKIINKLILLPSNQEQISNLKELAPNIKTAAEIFKLSGYRTGGFTGGAGVDSQYGFDEGFEIYTDDLNFGGFSDSILKALEWIKQHKDEKLFIFLHGYDIHGQHTPQGGYDRRFVDFDYKGKLTGSKEEQKKLREEGIFNGQIYLTKDDVRFLTALYDEKIQRADELFSQFIKEYGQIGLMDKTVFVLTSDHGEELYEHGRIDHGHSLYDELVKVPLIITLPDWVKNITIDSQVRNIDILPTVLEIIGVKSDAKKQFNGQSLIAIMAGDGLRLNAFSETDYRFSTKLRSLRSWDLWKLIFNFDMDSKELFNLNSDPYEKVNLNDRQPEKSSELEKISQDYFDE